MSLKTLVKVGNITNLSDARYCAGMGVEMLGFSAVEGSENFVDPKSYQEIRGWVTGPSVFIEIYGVQKDALQDILTGYVPDFLELAIEDLNALSPEITTPLLLALQEEQWPAFKVIAPNIGAQIEYIILNEASCSVDFIKKISKEFKVLLSPEKENDMVALIELTGVAGIALNGSKEFKPGLKDYDHLADILEQLEAD